jgi:hypothetical protein
MRKGVIADNVTSLRHFPCNLWPLLHVASNHEKRSKNIVPRQNVEQLKRVRIVWTIIERESDLPRSSS